MADQILVLSVCSLPFKQGEISNIMEKKYEKSFLLEHERINLEE